MDLILWRHADCGGGADGKEDFDRPLSARGRKQAREAAEWLRQQHLPRLRVVCAPSRQARETAGALSAKACVLDVLAPGHLSVHLLAALDWPDSRDPVLVVGHQPLLGRLAALLLAGQEADWSIKKGGLWWFTNRVRLDETQTVLRAVRSP